MPLRLYNTLTKSTQDFVPIDPTGAVRFYSCGPTVYDDAHIGNFRSFLNADLLRRTLELCGYQVRHVMNITDVGHMTEDDNADGGGEDKMSLAGRRIAEAKTLIHRIPTRLLSSTHRDSSKTHDTSVSKSRKKNARNHNSCRAPRDV